MAATGTSARAQHPGMPLLAGAPAAAASSVPLRQAGPGWVLAEYWAGRTTSQGRPKSAPIDVYLISPSGRRYLIHHWAPTRVAVPLQDWSGDKTRALIFNARSGGYQQLSLATGRILSMRAPKSVILSGYTKPRGQQLYGFLQSNSSQRLSLVRLYQNGSLAKILATNLPGINAAAESPDGTLIATASPHGGLELISNRGGVVRQLPIARTSECVPVRWWDARAVLASCVGNRGTAGQLWVVPAQGSRPRLLAQLNGPYRILPPLSGAWQAGRKLYLNASGPACGSDRVYSVPVSGTGTAVPVPVPALAHSGVLAVAGSRLLVLTQTGCLTGQSLLWYNTATHRKQTLLAAPANVTGVVSAIPYGLASSSFIG